MYELIKVFRDNKEVIETLSAQFTRFISGVGVIFIIAILLDFAQYGLFLTILRTLIVLTFVALIYAAVEAFNMVINDSRTAQ
jgi:ABC-type bacteriocin/lantibiotic exporter with double-glycine peptidase domain